MARKEITVTIPDRDRDLTFRIREMPATKLERWVLRALLLLSKSGRGADAEEAVFRTDSILIITIIPYLFYCF